MTSEAISRTIQLILAPVVMVSACSIFVSGILTHYTSVSDRIRALARERLDRLRDLRGAPNDRTLLVERLAEIDGELPDLAHRHLVVHHALVAVYAAIGILILTMCIIALTATTVADWVGPLVFGMFLAGVLMTLLGVVLTTLEIRMSRRSLVYEVERVSRLPPDVTPAPPLETAEA